MTEFATCPFCLSAAIEHAEIPLSEGISCPAHVQCQGCGAMAPASIWNTRSTPRAMEGDGNVLEAARAINAAIQTGLWRTPNGESVKMSPIAVNLAFALTRHSTATQADGGTK